MKTVTALLFWAMIVLLPVLPAWEYASARLTNADDVENVAGVFTAVVLLWWLYIGVRIGGWICANVR